MSFMNRNIVMTAAVLMSCASSTIAFAQQGLDAGATGRPGVVRITDRVPQNGGQPVTQMTAFHGHMGSAPCPTGNCPADSTGGAVGNPNAYCPYGSCPSGQCPHCRACRFGQCNGYWCKRSADAGYSPPAKYPLLRRGVQYSEYYPAYWYGTGPMPAATAPMVYQPTDTTQLGFYYQHVPFWMPDPNRVPARPIPAQWNVTAPPVAAYGFNGGYWNGYPRGYLGHHGHLLHHRRGRYYDNGYPCPVDGTVMPQQASPQSATPGAAAPSTQSSPTPADPSPATLPPDGGAALQDADQYQVPPVPSDDDGPRIKRSPQTDSASSGHIRRIGYNF